MNIPTAEQWVNQQFEKQRITTNGNNDVYCSRQGIIEACQIFAKLHVEAALKKAMHKADTKELSSMEVNEHYREEILHSYPLENIK